MPLLPVLGGRMSIQHGVRNVRQPKDGKGTIYAQHMKPSKQNARRMIAEIVPAVSGSRIASAPGVLTAVVLRIGA